MSKLTVQFDTKNITIPNDSCCIAGISTMVSIDGMVPRHRYYCELSSISMGDVNFAQNNFVITSSSSSVKIPLGFTLKNSRSYILKLRITDLDYRQSYRYWIPNKNEWYKSAYYNPVTESYSVYATQANTDPSAVSANSDGSGNPDDLNSINFNLGADWNEQDGNVTSVGTNGGPSYYNTYDQNGNINEWIDDLDIRFKPYIGGSWSSSLEDIKAIHEVFVGTESDDIGFRIAIIPDRDISINKNNYVLITGSDHTEDNPSTNPSDSNGLGSVYHSFYIKKYPVTNDEYALFLNAVASKTDRYGLYSSKMSTDPRGGILRITNSDQTLSYRSKDNMGDKPVNFVSWLDAARYCNWMHNKSLDNNSNETEFGTYDMKQNPGSAPYIGLNYSEDVVTIQCGNVSGHTVEFSDSLIGSSEEYACNKQNNIIATIKNAKIGRQYRYNFSSTDSYFTSIIPISGTIVAGNIEQNINTVYSYGGSLKKVDLKLDVIDLIDNITSSTSIILNCEDCSPKPTPTPTTNS
jgi:formylglycine-generating enzyme required for sulfatase activity